MAQNKYDLLLVEKSLNAKVRPQPWYKERLKTKYLKTKKPTDVSESLIGRNWVLIKPSIDDFRDGKPPEMGDGFLLERNKGISPVISQSNKSTISSEMSARKRLTKHQMVFSKTLPLQEQRRGYIDGMEYGLKQHPLGLYPHLEDGMPPDEIVDILDPDMNPDEESEMSTSTSQRELELEEPMDLDKLREQFKVPTSDSKMRNPYKWILRKESSQKDDKRGAKKRPTSPSQDEHIKKVTKDFCDWVSDLGGESNNVEESTIMSLFASGYETKPALSVPIHVVEISNVPIELRTSAGVSSKGSARKSATSSAVATTSTKLQAKEANFYEPSWVKIKYGAWYLDPKSWKPRLEGELLEDPEEVEKREQSEAKKKSDEMDMELAPLHGARAFRKFMEKTSRRKPEFMDKVSNIQDEIDEKNNVLNEDGKTSCQSRLSHSLYSRNTGRIQSGYTNRSRASSGFR